MLTVRLDSELEAKVGIVAKNMHVSKSELVRRSLVEFVKNTPKLSPWQLGKELFGKYESENSDLSQNRKILIKSKISAKT
ncbi:MAG: CopG family transcriptional regulator [Candidatus Thioglobus sp.]|jgi:hypothetical protein|uniref:CopG family transcriptional regulator n=1 Tax=uncultured Candidatus Thioglobus sp. TaxID=655186 RepID=UPI0001BAC58F|nr:hypothetical protein SUP05_FGYC49P140010 [uncultured Candidatus Thioglobus sp.]EEZ80295.1 MAG: hypothetical protein Sup05_1238 [uncultured Candidatus Thioglobus sp.]MBT5784225.1 CopG family transcriptional regulator [Candidatus Thioglobus sp.]MBT6327687.1 CopG family transcriptional regulator [Candidatus Thioglobus sp.]MBT7412388.1 CopG family transcriptional regulator [Candidatus Thioglobus sp.]